MGYIYELEGAEFRVFRLLFSVLDSLGAVKRAVDSAFGYLNKLRLHGTTCMDRCGFHTHWFVVEESR
jgi:hypothetical protein